MEPSQDALLATIDRFITREKGPMNEPLQPDTALLQGGLLDSFNLVRLAQEIGQEFQRDIPRGSLVPDDFETPAVLWARLSEIWAEG